MSDKLNPIKLALKRKEAELDAIDDQLMGMPDLAPEAPMDAAPSGEFDLLSEKREELEEEIRQMREGIQLISEWEKLKGGQWSEEIKMQLGDIDAEIANIADGVGAEAPMGDMGMGLEAPPAPEMAPEPALPLAPEAAPAPEVAETPEIPVPAPEEAPPAPEAAPMASTRKKNNYQISEKKAISSAKEGSTMDKQTPKASLKEKLAEIKTKRESIKKEAQVRVAAAWTIAKTMLPSAPQDVQRAFASNLLQNPTKVLNAALRQTAKNAHYTKVAETFKEVHKVEMNDLLEDPSILNAEKKAVESEVKGEAKSAAIEPKKADDRKDAGPQTETYNDGRGHGGGTASEPKEMDAGKAGDREMDTVNKSEGDKKGKEASACAPCAAGKKAAECTCEGPCKCDVGKEAAAKKADSMAAPQIADTPIKPAVSAPAAPAATPVAASKEEKKEAAAKTAQPVMDAPPAGDMPAPDMPADMGAEPPMDAAPAEELPAELPAEGEESAGDMLTDEKKVVVEEKIEEAQEAIRALEQEILDEGEEEINLEAVFGEDGEGSEEMEEKVSALANEGDEKMAAEDYFAPTSAESLEASLDEPQMASMEDFFSLQGSDADPLASLIAGVKTSAEVAGFDVLESFTGEAAKHFEQKETGKEDRDNESDHDGDLFAEAIEGITPEEQGAKRTPQDAVNELEQPKAAAAKTASAKPVEKKAAPVVKKLKPVVASAPKPVDIASALFGEDE